MKKQKELEADHIVSGEISGDERSYSLKLKMLGPNQEVVLEEEFLFGVDAESQIGAQRRISQRISKVLGTTHAGTEYCEPSNNIEAMVLYHSAKLKLDQKGVKNLAGAESLLLRAIELDPGYGHAYSALSIAYLLQSRWKPEYRGDLSVEITRKALDRCATLGVAYKIWVPSYEGVKNNWIDQEIQWRDALAISPSDLWLLDNYSLNLGPLGMGTLQDIIFERANRINPIGPRVLLSKAWHALLVESDIEKALQLAEQIESEGERSCNVPNLRLFAALSISEEAAIEAWEAFQLTECSGGGVRMQYEKLGPELIYQSRHNPSARRKLLDYMRDGLEDNPNMAMINGINLSDLTLAFDAIEFGMANDRYIHMPLWWMDNSESTLFRRDVRFAKLVQRMDFPDYWREFGWPDGKCTPLGDSFVWDN
ncbi:MAG: hypothetical protein VB957_19000 [Pseudomonadales bacterium]